jgi:hypothetical protein
MIYSVRIYSQTECTASGGALIGSGAWRAFVGMAYRRADRGWLGDFVSRRHLLDYRQGIARCEHLRAGMTMAVHASVAAAFIVTCRGTVISVACNHKRNLAVFQLWLASYSIDRANQECGHKQQRHSDGSEALKWLVDGHYRVRCIKARSLCHLHLVSARPANRSAGTAHIGPVIMAALLLVGQEWMMPADQRSEKA